MCCVQGYSDIFTRVTPPLVIYTKYCINWQCVKNCECPVLGPERSVSPPVRPEFEKILNKQYLNKYLAHRNE